MPFESVPNASNNESENPDKILSYAVGGDFLRRKFDDLSKSKYVTDSHEWSDQPIPLKRKADKAPASQRIATWLRQAENFHKRHRDNPEAMEIIQAGFEETYVIKPENVPESYFANQVRLAREQGIQHEISPKEKERLIATIIQDQAASLKTWTEYLFSEDADFYPMWAKYWALRGVTSMGTFDKEKGKFSKRRSDTVTPFADLNREALAYALNMMDEKVRKVDNPQTIENPQLLKILDSESFAELYAYALEKTLPGEPQELAITEGEWIKYDQGSDHMPLVQSLEGYGTGWCTAGASTAETQLQNGDFYVYYSKDKDGNNTIPRAAIRMDGKDQIGEVRGIGPEQNLDPFIADIVESKLQDFPDAASYAKKTRDMKLLTVIDNKQTRQEELSREDLRFLYEIDEPITGFGYEEDLRIKKIQSQRNVKEDLSQITGFKVEEIGTSREEALSGKCKLYYGNLDLDTLTDAQKLQSLEIVLGSLDLYNLTSAKGLENLKEVGWYLYLRSLTSAKGLENLEQVGGDLILYNLTSAEGLENLEQVGWNLYLRSLTSAKGLENLEQVGGDLILYNLTSAKGLENLKQVGGYLDLESLTSAEGLENLLGTGHHRIKISPHLFAQLKQKNPDLELRDW